MPNSDQKVSSSAALQRPQRQKATSKPVVKTGDKNIETNALTQNAEDIGLTDGLETIAPPETLQAPESGQTLETPQVAEAVPTKVKKVLQDVTELRIEANEKLKSKPLLKPKQSKPPATIAENLSSDLISDPISDQISEIDLLKNSNTEAIAETITETNIEAITEAGIETNLEEIDSASKVLAEQNFAEQNLIEPALMEQNFEDHEPDLENDPEKQNNDKTSETSAEFPQDDAPIFWCQAVGMVVGKYVPSAEAFQKGAVITENGLSYKAFVLSKAIKSLEKKTDLSLSHQFVIYPKTSKLHGVRFEILATDVASKVEEFASGQFNIRGLVTKQLENSTLIEIQRRPEYLHPTQYDRFSLEVRGDIPAEMMQQFIYVRCELVENYLSLVSFEHLACPILPKSVATPRPVLKPKASIITSNADISPDNGADNNNLDNDNIEAIEAISDSIIPEIAPEISSEIVTEIELEIHAETVAEVIPEIAHEAIPEIVTEAVAEPIIPE